MVDDAKAKELEKRLEKHFSNKIEENVNNKFAEFQCRESCEEEPEDPFCGNDGQTYYNGCELRCSMKYNKSLKPSYVGECETQPQTGEFMDDNINKIGLKQLDSRNLPKQFHQLTNVFF